MASVRLVGPEVLHRRGAWTSPWLKEDEPGGIIDLSARYANSDIDRQMFFNGLTTFGESSQEVRTFTATLSYQPVPHLRLSFSWVHTLADQFLNVLNGGDRDSTYLLRLEARF